MEGIARQPEAASKIQTAMIIAAALIEGVALFGVVVALLGNNPVIVNLKILDREFTIGCVPRS